MTSTSIAPSNAIRDMSLVVAPTGALSPPEPTSVALMFERLAADPHVDVEKLDRLIQMQERILRYNAEAAFNAAFAQMQAQIPTIAERGRTDKATYATLEDIIEAIRPILHRFGFALSHETEWPNEKTVKVIGILQHKDGHSRRSVFLSAADTTGSKNAIQALGSAMSYGRRYTAMDLLNITTRLMDDDGQKSGKPEPPEGYDIWFDALQDVAAEGIAALERMWAASKKEFTAFAAKHDLARKDALKATARKVKA